MKCRTLELQYAKPQGVCRRCYWWALAILVGYLAVYASLRMTGVIVHRYDVVGEHSLTAHIRPCRYIFWPMLTSEHLCWQVCRPVRAIHMDDLKPASPLY